jgi:hypothetical protein
MKTIIAIIGITALMAGCTTPGLFINANKKNDCDGKGQTLIKIGYGDSYLEATPRGWAKRKGEIVYKLEPRKNQPSGIDYSNVDVKISGKRDPEDKWLDKYGKAGNGSNKIFVCVDENLPYGTYGFDVEVPGVGKIDPRIDVTN